MSVQRTESQPSYPVTTTTTNTTTVTTTTTTLNAEQAISAPPSLAQRPVGWHAKASGFDWNKRSEQHRYRLSIGLPEIHAAVVNHDWETAGEMLCPGDIGLLWMPPVSQHYSANDGKDTENGAWALKLPSKRQSTQLEAVRQMAMDMGSKTVVEGSGCLYGANLLTLCLQTSASPEFMEKLMLMVRKSPQYLDLPDASGRTPLYVAVERGDEKQVAMLLSAGASPLAPCSFQTSLQGGSAGSRAQHNAQRMSAYKHAFTCGNIEIFSLLIENILKSSDWKNDYLTDQDPLRLRQWASVHTDDEIRDLANKLSSLKTFLFNVKDKTGLSLVDRHLAQKKPLPEDVTPLFNQDPELGAIHVAAAFADIEAFELVLNTYCAKRKFLTPAEDILIENFITIFLENCSPSDVPQLWTQCSKLGPLYKYVTCSPRNLLLLPFEKFSALVHTIWPILAQEERQDLINTSKNVDATYTTFLMQLSKQQLI